MPYTNIDDPSAHFQAFTYTGTGTTNSITLDGNSDLQPDLYWYKTRSNSNYHYLADSSRGTTKYIYPNDSLAEGTVSSLYVQSFDTNGVTLGAGDSGTNTGGTTFANWVWKANGGTTTSVSASGTGANCINASTHQVNQDAGFSIITYTGRADQITVHQQTNLTHGLGVAPDLTIMKKRDATGGWVVMGKHVTTSSAYSANEYLRLDTSDAISNAQYTGYVAPTSTYIYLGDALVNDTGNDYICYAFAEKQGYSKFGSYIGNGESLNGPFVYTGFSPAFVMIKNTETGGRNWYIYDTKRRAFNANGTVISANTTGAEATDQAIDILSNGFKVRPGALGSFGTSTINHSGQKMIYMAFAENPFTTSTGIPTTAR